MRGGTADAGLVADSGRCGARLCVRLGGHFFFEHNRPATFKYPGFSFVGDWRMWWDILTGKIPL